MTDDTVWWLGDHCDFWERTSEKMPGHMAPWNSERKGSNKSKLFLQQVW